VVLGHFTALFLHDNQVIFTKDGKQCAVPYYLGPIYAAGSISGE
jgi:hypothetical protein